MNHVVISGFLGADPEERHTTSGKKVFNLRIATKVWHNGKDETIWWRVSIWDERLQDRLRHFKKGGGIVVCGSMNPVRTYTDRNGQQQVSLEMTAQSVDFPLRSGERNEGQQTQAGTATGGYQQPAAEPAPFHAEPAAPSAPGFGTEPQSQQGNITEDDLPF